LRASFRVLSSDQSLAFSYVKYFNLSSSYQDQRGLPDTRNSQLLVCAKYSFQFQNVNSQLFIRHK